jgi:hypothetical protein
MNGFAKKKRKNEKKKKKKKKNSPLLQQDSLDGANLQDVIMGEIYSGDLVASAKPAITNPQLATGPQNCE